MDTFFQQQQKFGCASVLYNCNHNFSMTRTSQIWACMGLHVQCSGYYWDRLWIVVDAIRSSKIMYQNLGYIFPFETQFYPTSRTIKCCLIRDYKCGGHHLARASVFYVSPHLFCDPPLTIEKFLINDVK